MRNPTCIRIDRTDANNPRSAARYHVETLSGVLYEIYLNPSQTINVRKSTNGGMTWPETFYVAGTTANQITYLTIWYDRWSGLATDLIHCAWVDDTVDNVLYRNFDTGNADTLSAETIIFDGASQAAGGTIGLTRTRGGNIICGGCIDAGAELFCYKSTDTGGTWSSIAAVTEATTDQLILLPGWAVDNQDAMCFFWDASADEISRKLYDDSANSWSEQSISGSMTDVIATTSFPHFAAAVDVTNSQNILVAWSAVDTANADLRCWTIKEDTTTPGDGIVEKTNVVLNSTDDQGMCAIGIDINTNYWYVFYGGKSDGSETWGTDINIYYKVSQDAGTTWGTETKLTKNNISIVSLFCSMRFSNYKSVTYLDKSTVVTSFLYVNFIADKNIPHSTYQLGM